MKLLVLIPILAYLFVCVAAFLLQNRMAFFPERGHAVQPSDFGLKFRDVFFVNARGERLHGWFLPAANARFTLLYCHGNAGNISHRIESIQRLLECGLSVFIFDYSGYGRSEGRPGEAATYDDARAAWDWLTRDEGVPERSIVVLGRSLGAAVTVDLATEVDPSGVILISPFTTAVELASRMYPWLPLRYLMRIRYDSVRKIRGVRAPKLFVHSLDDEVVPYGMGKRLYNRAPAPKTWVKVRGSHDEPYLAPGSEFGRALEEFLESVAEVRGPHLRPL